MNNLSLIKKGAVKLAFFFPKPFLRRYCTIEALDMILLSRLEPITLGTLAIARASKPNGLIQKLIAKYFINGC